MKFRCFSAAFVGAALSCSSAMAQTGTVKAQFVYGGSAIDPTAVDVNKDVQFCGNHKLINERLLINQDNNGIKNVVMHVYTGRGGSELDKSPNGNATKTLANEKCRFEPHVVVLQVGDTLEITNPDAVGHNANLNFLANPGQNPTIPPAASVKVKIGMPEPGVIPVDCNIHPWMRAYLVVLDHPFAGVSDEDGMLEIKDVPAGSKLVFRLSHEAADGAIKEVTIGGKSESLKRNLIEIDVKPGMNDLGKITIPAGALKP